jgi:hypothetical protein
MKRPKRKPDFVLKTYEESSLEFGECIEVWFKELVLHASSLYKGKKDRTDGMFYSIDRFYSLRGLKMWTYSICCKNGTVSDGYYDFNMEFETPDLDEKLEVAYQNWLAQTAIDKLLKGKG